MRSVGGGSAATCSGESASAVCSFVTVCSSYGGVRGHVSACVSRPSAGWQYLLDVGLSLRAMPCLGFCITTALGAVAAGGRAIGSCLGHVVRQGGNGGGGKEMVVAEGVWEYGRVGREGGGNCRD